jgi:hypothetical protein
MRRAMESMEICGKAVVRKLKIVVLAYQAAAAEAMVQVCK